MCFSLFSDGTSFCFLGVNMGWDANSLSARMLYLLHQFVPDAVLAHLVKYCIQALRHEDGQEQRLCSASIKFLRLRQIHDPSGISPVLDNALSTLLSCCSQHFFPLYILFRWSRSVTTTINKSQWQPAFACWLF